tara:strand:+ start:14048 stop:14551 length:504 start_codon:yes stop_codon:yes gene_type:complete
VNLIEIAELIKDLPLATAIRTGLVWDWLFPTIEALHVVAISTVFGSIILLDLRLLGMADGPVRVSAYSSDLLPLTWTAFFFAVITGSLMFISRAPEYLVNAQFQFKMALILLAGLNMAFFHWGIFRRIKEWDLQFPPPLRARLAGGISIVFWAGIVFFGRWIGFTMM